MLTRNDILGQARPEVFTVEVPEWGGSVCIKRMSCREAEEYQDWLMEQGAGSDSMRMLNMRAGLLAIVLCNADGDRLFASEDIEALGDLDSTTMHKLFLEAKKINSILEGAVEDSEKN